MRIGRVALAFLTVASLLLSSGVPVFCMPGSHGAMKCCKTKQASGTGMKRPDCCRFVPASSGQAPAAVEASFPSKISKDEIQGGALAESVRPVSPVRVAESQASPPPFLPRELSVPLFLLNTSLLR